MAYSLATELTFFIFGGGEGDGTEAEGRSTSTGPVFSLLTASPIPYNLGQNSWTAHVVLGHNSQESYPREWNCYYL